MMKSVEIQDFKGSHTSKSGEAFQRGAPPEPSKVGQEWVLLHAVLTLLCCQAKPESLLQLHPKNREFVWAKSPRSWESFLFPRLAFKAPRKKWWKIPKNKTQPSEYLNFRTKIESLCLLADVPWDNKRAVKSPWKTLQLRLSNSTPQKF